LTDHTRHIAIIGAGPAGLIAAEILSGAGHAVTIYDRKPSAGRKFLMAGRGGLNLTHSEPLDFFISRYPQGAEHLAPVITHFTPQDLRTWCEGLGQETFIGSSGRVFPKTFKASPLLRAWLSRLESQGVLFKFNHDWIGWQDGHLTFQTPEGEKKIDPLATLLALGGATWPKLGSDGSWVNILHQRLIPLSPLKPANCGFVVSWSDIFKSRYAGHALKPLSISHQNISRRGEIILTENGIEGGLVYALSSALREEIDTQGRAEIYLDLMPDIDAADISEKLTTPRKRESLTNYLRKTLRLTPPAIGLLMERPDRHVLGASSPEYLARLIKSYPLILTAPFGMERAISTAGGIAFNALDHRFMLTSLPGVFAAGEMLDWEAPTGGYLLQACFATGVTSAQGIIAWLSETKNKDII
jgi:uncharacterized flavoprotein (TIGR03862 family)